MSKTLPTETVKVVFIYLHGLTRKQQVGRLWAATCNKGRLHDSQVPCQ